MVKWAYAILLALFLAACSDDSGEVAGNSAETGSPELAGILTLDNGDPAGFADVQCVPQGFDAREDSLPEAFTTTTDSNGRYALDSIPAGRYSLEAVHRESGKRLLVQGLELTENDSLNRDGVLTEVGAARLLVPGEFSEGAEGVATVYGTTILRRVAVKNGAVVVDSLPSDSLDLLVFVDEGEPVEFVLNVEPGDTAVAGDTLVLRFVAPLALPEGYDSLPGMSTDLPLALRLDSSNCDFDAVARLPGLWEAARISADGSRSKVLPVTPAYFDTVAKRALFWVRLDSLNVADSVEFLLNTAKPPRSAQDVFPTNRVYNAVWHFYSGVDLVEDDAEKARAPGEATNVKVTEGVLGPAAQFSGEGSSVEAADSLTGVNVSISMWVKLNSLGKRQGILTKGKTQFSLVYAPDSGLVFSVYHEAEAPVLDSAGNVTNDTASYRMYLATGDSVVKAGEWMFVAFNYNGAVSAFVDGVKLSILKQKEPWTGKRDSSTALVLGGFDGAVDEFFLGGSFRTDDWTLATYLNQSPEFAWPRLQER